MTELNARAVGHAHRNGLGQQVAGPVLLGPQTAVKAGALRQFGKEVAIVVPEPVAEGSLGDVLDGLDHANDPQCAEGKDGLAMVGALGKASSIWQNSSVIKSGMCIGVLAAKCCQPAGCKNSMTNSTFSETSTIGWLTDAIITYADMLHEMYVVVYIPMLGEHSPTLF